MIVEIKESNLIDTDCIDEVKNCITNGNRIIGVKNTFSSKQFYYDYSKIDSFQCPVKIVISQRGLGKTFGKIKSFVESYITSKKRFIYIVETGEMVKELSRNNGEKFFVSLNKYYESKDTSRKKYFFDHITKLEVENEDKEIFSANIKGGTILINKETAGYIIDLNSFSELKRNNFDGVKNILIDEFISEKLDRRSLDNPKRVSSIVQSIGRLRDINIYLLGNAIRKNDPILSKLGFKVEKYGLYKKYDDYGLIAVLDFVDPNKYNLFTETAKKSVAGRFSKLLGEDLEEKNIFIEDLPKDRYIKNIQEISGTSLNVVSGDLLLSFLINNYDKIYCIPFSRGDKKCLVGLKPRDQGYKFGMDIICNYELKKTLLKWMQAGVIYYYSEIEYTTLKEMLK